MEFSSKKEILPKNVVFALEYMEKHIKEKITFIVLFRKYFGMTPLE